MKWQINDPSLLITDQSSIINHLFLAAKKQNKTGPSEQAQPEREHLSVATTHKASGAQGLLCGEGVVREGGVAQEGLQLAADIVGLEMRRFHIGHGYVQPFHDCEDL